jgi:hypothetical protein
MSSRYCPKCGVEARDGARFCAACGVEVPGETGGASAGQAAPLVPAAPVENFVVPPVPLVPVQREVSSGTSVAAQDLAVFPWWQVIVFLILSFGFWAPYWFFCTRKQLNTVLANGKTDPGVQALGMFVPIWSFWVARDLWRDINDAAKRAGTQGIDSKSYTVAYVICSIPIINYIGGIVMLVLFVITQSRLMSALTALAGGKTINRRLTVWNVVWVVVPFLFWVLVVGSS